MTYKIYFAYPDNTEDSIVLSADTLEELREKVKEELARRGADYLWSEKIN